ncbi:MAG: hypothetical protein V7K67_33005 [Nostoc sp.]|uniref:hypothetical protein n=2 Tax=Nostoc sp. TaxID=1180 RepID=UPI002FF5390C
MCDEWICIICDRFICTHYKDGSLPVQEEEATPPTTENQIMVHIFNECQNYRFEILDDGIYNNNGVMLEFEDASPDKFAQLVTDVPQWTEWMA